MKLFQSHLLLLYLIASKPKPKNIILWHKQTHSQKPLLGGSFGQNVDLFGKIVDLVYKAVDLLIDILVKSWLFKQNSGLFSKLMDLLFRKGGSSAPREPPWLWT